MKEKINDAVEFIGGKKVFFIIGGVIVGIFLINSIGVAVNKKNAPVPSETSLVEETSEAESSESSSEETSEEIQNSSEDQIEIVAGELGAYGQVITLNENTDFADVNYCYFVPVGTYQITNVGDYMTQVDVNKNERGTDVDNEGNEYEYWSDCTPYVLDVGDTEEITVQEGYFIELEEPAHIVLVPKGDIVPQDVSQAEVISIDSYVALLDIAMSDAFGENYSITVEEDNTIVISVWGDGVAQSATMAASGDADYQASWDEFKDSMQAFAQTTYDNACSMVDVEEPHIFLHVLNDQNLDNTLLSYYDGVLIYDSVQ